MAKSKGFFGLRSGSTKSLTFSVLEGKQITKDRVYHVANPRSSDQSTQRMKIRPALTFYNRFSSVLDHSFEGYAYGNKSRRRFMQLAMANPALTGCVKGDTTLYPAPYQVSEGTLTPITMFGGDEKVGFALSRPVTEADIAILEAQTLNRSAVVPLLCELFEIEVGGQLTFIGFEEGFNSFKPYIGRIILDSESSVVDDLSSLLTDYINFKQGNPVGYFDDTIHSGVVIKSLFENKVWRRSTQSMAVPTNIIAEYNSPEKIEQARASYMVDSDPTSSWYLNEGEDVNV